MCAVDCSPEGEIAGQWFKSIDAYTGNDTDVGSNRSVAACTHTIISTTWVCRLSPRRKSLPVQHFKVLMKKTKKLHILNTCATEKKHSERGTNWKMVCKRKTDFSHFVHGETNWIEIETIAKSTSFWSHEIYRNDSLCTNDVRPSQQIFEQIRQGRQMKEKRNVCLIKRCDENEPFKWIFNPSR